MKRTSGHGVVEVYNTFEWKNGYNGIALIASDERFREGNFGPCQPPCNKRYKPPVRDYVVAGK